MEISRRQAIGATVFVIIVALVIYFQYEGLDHDHIAISPVPVENNPGTTKPKPSESEVTEGELKAGTASSVVTPAPAETESDIAASRAATDRAVAGDGPPSVEDTDLAEGNDSGMRSEVAASADATENVADATRAEPPASAPPATKETDRVGDSDGEIRAEVAASEDTTKSAAASQSLAGAAGTEAASASPVAEETDLAADSEGDVRVDITASEDATAGADTSQGLAGAAGVEAASVPPVAEETDLAADSEGDVRVDVTASEDAMAGADTSQGLAGAAGAEAASALPVAEETDPAADSEGDVRVDVTASEDATAGADTSQGLAGAAGAEAASALPVAEETDPAADSEGDVRVDVAASEDATAGAAASQGLAGAAGAEAASAPPVTEETDLAADSEGDVRVDVTASEDATASAAASQGLAGAAGAEATSAPPVAEETDLAADSEGDVRVYVAASEDATASADTSQSLAGTTRAKPAGNIATAEDIGGFRRANSSESSAGSVGPATGKTSTGSIGTAGGADALAGSASNDETRPPATAIKANPEGTDQANVAGNVGTGPTIRESLDEQSGTKSVVRVVPPSETAKRADPGQLASATDKKPVSAEPARRLFVLESVSVDPDGNTVIAGRAEPRTRFEFRDGEQVLGETRSDRFGHWVFLPDQPLGPGEHLIVPFRIDTDGEAIAAGEAMVAVVPGPGKDIAGQDLPADGTGDRTPLVVIVPHEDVPATPSRIAQIPLPVAPDAGQADNDGKSVVWTFPEPQHDVDGGIALESIDYDDTGDVVFSGRAEPGKTVQVFVDNSLDGTVQTSPEGNWAVSSKLPDKSEEMRIRVEQIDEVGAVTSRIEIPFVAARPFTSLPNSLVVIVQPGNSLWRISRRILGKGVRYTEIFQANMDQIRDPHLIYPGQVFGLPRTSPAN